MATLESTPPVSTSPSSTDNVPGTPSALEKELALLQDRFAALEHKFSALHGKDITITENTLGEVTKLTVDAKIATSGATDAGTEGEKSTGPPSRAKILINKLDPATGERTDRPPSETVHEPTKTQDESHAFVLRKIIGYKPQDNNGELDILSPSLWNLLKKLLSHYPYHTFQGDHATIDSPYEALVHYWDKLEKAAKEPFENEEEKQARLDLKVLLDTVSSQSGDQKLDKYFKMRGSLKEQKMVTFDTLWTLFSPGALMYGKPFLGQDQVFIVQDNVSPWPLPKDKTWTLICWTYDWDGKMFKRMALNVEIERFDGQKPIISLPYYPLEYHPQPHELRRRLSERGAMYKVICTTKQGLRMFDYKGHVVFAKKGFSGIGRDDDQDDDPAGSSRDQDLDDLRDFSQSTVSGRKEAASRTGNIDSRVMVDFESYFRYGPAVAQSHTGLQEMFRTRFDKEACQENWEEEQYWLCPPRVLGYILRDKQWAQLQVNTLQKIPKDDPNQSWDRVKLADGDKTKKIILDLVKGHEATDTGDDSDLAVSDIVAKKGKGLVILLYGPPGVGKTSTAETVAIAARKPLFSISVADVGTEAEKVEANLAKLFSLATAWQAILLIDEADVFLESRGKVGSNTERNALVSVFLRVLEYYQGILMLTTNQIAQFDVAVQSRIHIAIKYTKLSEMQTKAIFEGFLTPLFKKGCVKDIDGIRTWIEEDVCRIGLDGRQIRNIVTSALGLARAHRKSKLEMHDLKIILNNVKDYKDDFRSQFEAYKLKQDGMVV